MQLARDEKVVVIYGGFKGLRREREGAANGHELCTAFAFLQ